MSPAHTNRLIHSSSPYLLQHAHNPVDWYEWGDEAFAKAKREDKLLLVSIGYSACHWCHVMAHECFEKEDTAQLMNDLFVCIKVDREERPDIDQVYMDAVQLLTGQGGWPLNAFVLPDGRPVHAGTYFPKAEWERVLKTLAGFYHDKREEALAFATDLTNGIRQLNALVPTEGKNTFDFAGIRNVVDEWKKTFDLLHGGFSWAPKFPMPNSWRFFLQYHYHTGDAVVEDGLRRTLDAMAGGGIYDQLGGGFARYSTDMFWKAPHFEKMLYDNAQLLGLYALAFQATGDKHYKEVAYGTAGFILAEMTSAEGLFYSALDADTEGVEGKYYTWTHDELAQLLGDDEPLFSLYYSADTYGNWEHGRNILYKSRSNESLERLTGKSTAEIEAAISECKSRLLAERNKRVRPGLDDKCITSWNALAIKGFAEAYRVFNEKKFLVAAEKCARCILSAAQRNGLHRIYKNGKKSIPAFAEDYACMIDALISLYQSSADEYYLVEANGLMKLAIEKFYRAGQHLFAFTSGSDQNIVAEKLDVSDDVIPSPNSIFANCLFMLGHYFDNDGYNEMAGRMVSNIIPRIDKLAGSSSNWLILLTNLSRPFYQVVFSGDGATERWRDFNRRYLPNLLAGFAQESTQIPLLKEKTGSGPKIYVCENRSCRAPVTDVAEALQQIAD